MRLLVGYYELYHIKRCVVFAFNHPFQCYRFVSVVQKRILMRILTTCANYEQHPEIERGILIYAWNFLQSFLQQVDSQSLRSSNVVIDFLELLKTLSLKLFISLKTLFYNFLPFALDKLM